MPKIKTPERMTVEDILLHATGYRLGDMLYYKPIVPFIGSVILNDRLDFPNSHLLSNGAQVVAPEGDSAAHVSIFRRGVASVFRVEDLQETIPSVKKINQISYSPGDEMVASAFSPESLVYVAPSFQWQTINLAFPTIDPYRRNIGAVVQTMDKQQLAAFRKIAMPLYHAEVTGNNSVAAA